MNNPEQLKEKVHDFWNEASCGEELFLKGADSREQFQNQQKRRYELEPYIFDFAQFGLHHNKKVLEIGVGLGADHQQFAASGCELHGCDLTERAIENTSRRLHLFGLKSNLIVADAENLPYADKSFDLVYSWGVIHHSPDTPRAVAEIYRILKPGGETRIMIYHTYSMVGFMLWFRYALLTGKPFRSLSYIYAHYLESPGTKAYRIDEAKKMFNVFSDVHISIEYSHGDLLSKEAGQRHRGLLLTLAQRLYPAGLIRKIFPKYGLFMLIRAQKNS
ncbi:MAG: class I SAM-dependent methyltransferase [Chitinophagales bacterium]|nr:class I SAM-dependent methyltransferase [Chitinophagales bacterium]